MHHPRRGSNAGGGSGSTLSTPASSGVIGNSLVQADDYQSSLLIQSQPPPAGSSSPGPQQHPPPHSLNLHAQTQPPAQSQAGAQMMKKKSGFQITSVTPAQISVSTNNSIAEDTESYDDLDESHTEDLSSSEILDVSLSRANDMAGAERSSSEETLNNFHEAETPGAVSPNQSRHPHALTHAPQHGGTMVNGTVHHHHQHHHHPPPPHPHQGLAHPPSAPISGALSSVAQKKPSNMGVTLENVSIGPPSVAAQPVAAVVPGSVLGMHSSAAGATVSIVNPLTSNVSNVNMLSSANVPAMGGISTSASSSGGFPVGVMSSSGGGGVMGSNVSNPCVNAPVPAMAPAPVVSSQPQPAPAPAPAATSSRFRVVKLDSSSEPFKKGRWTCTEYYEKETPASAPAPPSSSSEAAGPSGRVGEMVRQCALESVTGGSERESTSGSSVSSTVSTLSHYTESVGSGEAGGPLLPQPPPQLQDYTSHPQGLHTPLPVLSMGVAHPQPHLHPQDLTHAHLKTTMAPSVPANIHQQAQINLQSTIGHPNPAIPQQQLTYAQAASAQAQGSTQGLAGVPQQQMGYAPSQQPSAAPQAAPVHIRPLSQGSSHPPEYIHPHPGHPQPTAPQALPHLAGSAPPGPGNGPGQIMGVPQQQAVGSMPQAQAVPQGLLQQQPQQTSSLQASTGGMVTPMGLGGVAGLGQPQGHPLPLEHQHQQQQQPQQLQSLPAQIPGLGTQLPNTVPPSQVAANVPPHNPQGDLQPQPQPQAHNWSGVGGMAQLPRVSLAQAHVHAAAAQATALYASLPSLTTTQRENAQRLLFHLPKLAGEVSAGVGGGLGLSTESSTTVVSALTASAGLFKAVVGEVDGSSGASVVAIDNKIEQAMDLVKSHLMYAVREEVEVLKEQIKELIERNSQLEQENTLLKTLASPEQMAQFQAQVQTGSPPAPTLQPPGPQPSAPAQPASHNSGPSA